MNRLKLLALCALLVPATAAAQPETPVEEWTGKTILLIGAHPDDDHRSHGTLAMLKDHGNEVYVLLMTLGNVGTRDPEMSRDELAKIRRQEEVDALAALGIPEENYINLGYDDGRLEYANREEAIGKLVYHIRKIRPDVLFAFEPGYGYQVWHKSDHRAASYLATDAVRAAEWHLLYEGQIIHQGLQAYTIPEFLFWGGSPEGQNTKVNITGYDDNRIEAGKKYVSQWSSGRDKYRGPNLEDYPPEDQEALTNRVTRRLQREDGVPYEMFRYYKGSPDGMGRGPRNY
jgi:LmbE family N-acetylglucosaminyl deacetylase